MTLGLRILGAGSNSNGQLGIGNEIDQAEFKELRFPTDYLRKKLSSYTLNEPDFGFEDPGWTVVSFGSGGRHSIFLIEFNLKISSSSISFRSLFGCGDSAQFQLGLGSRTPVESFSTYGGDNQEDYPKNCQSLLEIDHRHLVQNIQNIDEGLREAFLKNYQPKQVICCWETSFVVLAGRAHHQDQEDPQDDYIISFGSDDFGLRGCNLPLEDLSRPSLVSLPSSPDQLKPKRGQRNVKLFSSVKHVVAILEYVSSNEDQDNLVELVGWGATRQGQLGPMSSSSKPPRAISPRKLQLPTSAPVNSSLINIALGKEHTIISFPNKIWSWGNNRKNQISSELQNLDPNQIIKIESCWNSSFVLINDQKLGTDRYLLIGFGDNSQSQLGVEDLSLSKAQHLFQSSNSFQFCTGSEHVLLSDGRQTVWGWGWNEHGNLGGYGEPYELKTNRQVQVLFKLDGEREFVSNVFAGCATSFIVCRKRQVE
ncbi:hypothetical protein O181_086788 [Austropuccinia psidii MF-1]|uniref:RCC1/BLIP-II protein n=1 Tax=Austropuccinia psidii MF-1 TaxID=1389203 RepID=A0A9Q3INH0_9BASI|nr:hypothetical protein [Austropuccinia psidii MF-1]